LYIFARPFSAVEESVPVKIDSTLLSDRIFFVGAGMEEERERWCWRRYWRRRA
jgi:hypothetical protein